MALESSEEEEGGSAAARQKRKGRRESLRVLGPGLVGVVVVVVGLVLMLSQGAGPVAGERLNLGQGATKMRPSCY